jgi:tripartite-type tricarboxylate transporter receptor subunit TctC
MLRTLMRDQLWSASMLNRRRFVATSAAGIVGGHLPPFASASLAQIITKSARLIVGFPAGGAPDVVARLIAEHVKSYAPSVVVDNRPGAGGRLALEMLKGAAADGSVMGFTPVDQLALFPHIYTQLGYRPLEDFAPVTPVCAVQFLLGVGPRVPANVKTVGDFIGWCRDNPKAATYGTAGTGTHPHFIGIRLARAAAVPFVHAPYKGGVAAVRDVLGGHLAACISTIGTLLPSIQSGGLRALATTAPQRSAALRDVPTFREAGFPALDSLEQFGLLLPAGTPPNTVEEINHTIRKALLTDAMKRGLTKLSLEPSDSSPSEFAQLIASETRRWGKVVAEAGFKPMD